MLRSLRRSAGHVLVALGVIIFLIEDLLIRDLGAALGALARLPVIARAERWAQGLAPYPALALFALPALLILPFKLAAVALIVHGRVVWGLLTILAAKLTATAVVGRILILCRPSLLRLGWFRRADHWVTTTRTRIHHAIAETAVWQAWLRLKARWHGTRAGWSARVGRIVSRLNRRPT